MLVTTLSEEANNQAKIKYGKLHQYYKREFKQLQQLIDNKINKIKLLGIYKDYIDKDPNHGICPTYIKNLAEGIKWQDYDVLYIPEGIEDTKQEIVQSLGPKILVIGPGRLYIPVLYNNKSTMTHIIVATKFTGYVHFDKAFSNKKQLKQAIIIGDNYEEVKGTGEVKGTREVKGTVDTKETRIQKETKSNTEPKVDYEAIRRSPIATVFSMNEVFYNCESLQEVVFLGCDFTQLNEINMGFTNCTQLETIYIENFTSGKLYRIGSCFEGCKAIKELNLNSLNTAEIKDMSKLFKDCANLKEIALDKFNTEKVKTINSIFSGCYSLTRVNLRKWKLKSCTDKDNVFTGCYSLKHTGISRLDIKLSLSLLR